MSSPSPAPHSSRSAPRFAHLSDPHLTTLAGVRARDLLSKRALGYLSWRRRRRFEHCPGVLASLQRDLQQQRLTQVLITGDLTHIGLPQEFRQARDWLHSLGAPADVALVPGNHDACVADSDAQTFALWRDYLAGDNAQVGFPSLRVRGPLAFIGVSTALPTPPLLATGTAGAAQIAGLGELLRATAARGLFRVVYLHHCPLPGREAWRKRLTDAPALQQTLIREGVELVLHGHGHRSRHWQLDTRDGPAQVLAVPSASALGLHGREPAAYRCFEVEASADGWRLLLATRRYRREQECFVDAGAPQAVSLPRQHRGGG